MKRSIPAIVMMILSFFGIVLINACTKDETTPPVLTVIGASKINISLNSTYNDPGATASDAVDGSDVVSSDISITNPDVNLAGTYIIHYTAVNNGGISATAIRTVVVSNDAANAAGTYAVTDVVTGDRPGTYTYNVLVTASNFQNNQLYLADFSGLGFLVYVTAAISGNTIALNPNIQYPSNMNNPGSVSNGGGTVAAKDSIKSFNYIINYNNPPGHDDGTSTWVKL